jgi:hypothetical protein
MKKPMPLDGLPLLKTKNPIIHKKEPESHRSTKMYNMALLTKA